MSLYRQLLIFTLALFFVLFVGVWVDKLQSTRAFLSAQLESHAQDTATSLGLSLSPFIAESDHAAVETMLNAIFDRGYYRRIVIKTLEGATLSERTLTISIEQVPGWFINLIPLQAPGAEALIMAGWQKAGSVYVESHPGYAYLTLWQTAVLITIYFLFTGVIVLLLGGIGLRVLLRPLRKVEQQAEAICRREYEVQERLPHTRELRQVVETMNRMTVKVREMFQEQAAIAEKLRQSAFGDALTGLGNRRFLEAQVKTLISQESGVCKGSLLLIQINGLQEINDARGYAAGDELVGKAAAIIAAAAAPLASSVPARLGGGDFALFLPDLDREDTEETAATITDGLIRLAAEQIGLSDNICAVGGLYYGQPVGLEILLAEADLALSSARQAGPNRWVLKDLTDSKTASIRGKLWWQEALSKALSNKSLQVSAQKVLAGDAGSKETPIQVELFSQIILEDGKIVPAGIFIPVAEGSSLITDLDRQLAGLVIRRPEAFSAPAVAINLSAGSLADESFVDWLIYKLGSLPQNSPRIYFEFAEFHIVQNLTAAGRFARRIRSLGHGLGLDHYGRSFSNFSYLKSLKPDYVKIDAAFTRELEHEQSDSYFFIGALCGVAHSLDIKVIAEGVETRRQYDLLREQRLDGYQGFLLDRPEPLNLSA